MISGIFIISVFLIEGDGTFTKKDWGEKCILQI